MNEVEIKKMQEDAQRWQILESSGILAKLKEINDNFPLVMIELSTLQKMIIDNVEGCKEDFPHLRGIVDRMTGIVHDVYYNSEIFD